MIIIITCVIICAGLYIVFDIMNKQVLKYIFKPATTLLVITLVLVKTNGNYELYSIFIITGLIFSLIGDIYLMLPDDKFFKGLVSFFVAHIFFVISFVIGFGPYFDILLLIPAIVYAIVFLIKILPKTGELKIPVLLYSGMLVLFLWQATGRFYYLADSSALFTFTGAIMFVISDSILGYSKFIKKSHLSTLLIHVTYWGALTFFALSV
jgi:uncharacterized membrane protein YhhN